MILDPRALGNYLVGTDSEHRMKSHITLQLAVATFLMTYFASDSRSADRLLFVSSFAGGEQGCISTLRLDSARGDLEIASTMRDVEHPFFMAVAPGGKFLYSIHAEQFGGKMDEQVAAYSVDRATGKLSLLNRQSSRGTASCYLDVGQGGKTLVVANYSSGSVATLPIKSDGSLDQPKSFIQHRGSSILPNRQSEPHAHCFVISPDNRFAFAADLGTDQIFGYRLDTTQSQLAPHSQPFVRTLPGAGPRHLTFHPNGKHVYVINELANSITLFDYQPASGFLIERTTLSTLPPDFHGKSHTADVKISPDGRFAYGTNRGHDSIAAYRIQPDGQLQLIHIESSLGAGPQNLLITADSKFLLCANMPGNNLAVFRIAANGALQPVGKPLPITSPSCIQSLP